MSNDDIVMANYSMLLEVYFLFMDINLSLSGISLALLCERRDLQEETCCGDVRAKGGQGYRQSILSLQGKQGEGRGLFCFVFCFYKHKRSFPQMEGAVPFTVCMLGSSSKAKPRFLLLILQKPRDQEREQLSTPALLVCEGGSIPLLSPLLSHSVGYSENWSFSFFSEGTKV